MVACTGLWPYCVSCQCWSDENHPGGNRHIITTSAGSCTSKDYRKSGGDDRFEGERWRPWCRVCLVWADLAHIDSVEHHVAVSRWETEAEKEVPVTHGTSWSMRNFFQRLLEARLRDAHHDDPVRSITKELKTRQEMEE